MRKIDIKFIASSAIIAALYVALTWLLAPISYGSIQFRISEILVLLVFFNPKYALAIVLGTLISNTTSGLGWYDMVFGTLATLLSVLTITKCKNIYQAALAPVIFNGIIVALELYLALKIDIIFSFIYVSIGEAVVLFLMGIPTMNSIINNEMLIETLNLEYKDIKGVKKLDIYKSLSIVLSVVAVILFFTCPTLIDPFSSSMQSFTMLDLLERKNYIFVLGLIIPVLYLLGYLLLKGKLKLIVSLVLSLIYLGLIIYIPFINNIDKLNMYYSIYYVIITGIITLPIFEVTKRKD